MPKPRKPMPKTNPKRLKRLRAQQFGPEGYADFVRAHGCVIAHEHDGDWQGAGCSGLVEVAHLKSRGAGGGWRENTVGLCTAHHLEQHCLGVESFDQKYRTDLDLWACAITNLYEQENL